VTKSSGPGKVLLDRFGCESRSISLLETSPGRAIFACVKGIDSMLEMLERVFGPLRRYTAEFYSECAEEAWQSDFFEKDGKKSFFVVLLSDEEDPCFMVYLWREEGFFWISKSSNDVFKTEEEALKIKEELLR
jgi:hypothetical protein